MECEIRELHDAGPAQPQLERLLDTCEFIFYVGYGVDADVCLSLCRWTRENACLLRVSSALKYGRGQRSCLSAAVACGHAARVRTLLAAGARLAAQDAHGLTALHVAVLHRRPPLVHALLAAAGGGPASSLLLAATTRGGETAVHLAAGLAQGGVDVLRALLDAGGDADGGEHTRAPLLLALSRRDEASSLALVASLRDTDRQDAFGWTHLMHAVKLRMPAVVAALLSRGAGVNERGATFLSALTLALDAPLPPPLVEGRELEVGEEGEAADSDEEAEEEEEGRGDLPAPPSPSPPSPLTVSMEGVALQLMECGADTGGMGRDACTCLHLACLSGYASAALLLLRKDCTARPTVIPDGRPRAPPIDVNAPNIYGDTALHAAVRAIRGSAAGHPMFDVIKALLQCGAKVTPRDRQGCTPLHFSVRGGPCLLPVSTLLLEAGADPYARAGDGSEPARLAAALGPSMQPLLDAMRVRAAVAVFGHPPVRATGGTQGGAEAVVPRGAASGGAGAGAVPPARQLATAPATAVVPLPKPKPLTLRERLLGAFKSA